MGLKGSCGSSSGIGHQHGSLHLHKALASQVFTDGGQDPGTLDEGILYILVHDQVHISLAVTDIRIGQSMELLRKDLETLGKQGHGMGMDRDLAHLCSKYKALDPYDIANIHFLEILICVLTQVIPAYVALDVSLQVLDVAEGGFSHHTLAHHTSGDGNLLPLILCVLLFYICAVHSHIIFCDLERVLSVCLKLC